MSSHTPGPWKWRAVPDENGRGTLALLLESEARSLPLNDPCVLAVREDWFRALMFNPPGSADARLIAAAPLMYGALEAAEKPLLEWIGSLVDGGVDPWKERAALRLVREALIAARGSVLVAEVRS